jgi:hypothetical protein
MTAMGPKIDTFFAFRPSGPLKPCRNAQYEGHFFRGGDQNWIFKQLNTVNGLPDRDLAKSRDQETPIKDFLKRAGGQVWDPVLGKGFTRELMRAVRKKRFVHTDTSRSLPHNPALSILVAIL